MAKVKNKKLIKKNEFRKNKGAGNHPAYIYAQVGHDFRFIGVTHSDTTGGVKNIKLEKNPNPQDKRSAFIRPRPEQAKVHKFKTKEQGWAFSKNDIAKVDAVKNLPIKNDRRNGRNNGERHYTGRNTDTDRDNGLSKLNSHIAQRSNTNITKTKSHVKTKRQGGKR